MPDKGYPPDSNKSPQRRLPDLILISAGDPFRAVPKGPYLFPAARFQSVRPAALEGNTDAEKGNLGWHPICMDSSETCL